MKICACLPCFLFRVCYLWGIVMVMTFSADHFPPFPVGVKSSSVDRLFVRVICFSLCSNSRNATVCYFLDNRLSSVLGIREISIVYSSTLVWMNHCRLDPLVEDTNFRLVIAHRDSAVCPPGSGCFQATQLYLVL
ncbi:hypothetical protein R3P38DRAFT_337560 [Favolaschia claudopus]|uniref:Secreted protein n=1 Tax=Favolaschia claudopus TaxID=2862362 RepID=A0AAV9ZKK9_9AGAR